MNERERVSFVSLFSSLSSTSLSLPLLPLSLSLPLDGTRQHWSNDAQCVAGWVACSPLCRSPRAASRYTADGRLTGRRLSSAGRFPLAVTLELIRKRAEHNDKELSTLQEISLHQENVERYGPRTLSLASFASSAVAAAVWS